MISVIVPVYNVENYLKECVDSILSQTFSEFEVILVDDGSTDHSGVICDDYKQSDNRVKVIHQKNSGVSAARNAGMKIAKGEYWTFVDSDDVVSPLYLEVLHKVAERKQADIVQCKPLYFDDGESCKLNEVSSESAEKQIGKKEACLGPFKYHSDIMVVLWAKLYRRELFDGVEFPVGKINEDVFTTPKILYKADSIYSISDTLYGYRQRSSSIMHKKFSKKNFDAVEGFKHIEEFFETCDEKEIAKAAKEQFEFMMCLCNVRAHVHQCTEDIPDEYRVDKKKALIKIRPYIEEKWFEYYLSKLYPGLERPYQYAKKIKSIFKKR